MLGLGSAHFRCNKWLGVQDEQVIVLGACISSREERTVKLKKTDRLAGGEVQRVEERMS